MYKRQAPNTANGQNGRPDYHGGCRTGISAFVWLACSPGAFSAPAGLVGTLPRNAFPGPGTFTWDTSVTKTFSVTQRVKAEVRAQVYNLTNTPQFQNPDGNYTNGDFGPVSYTHLYPAVEDIAEFRTTTSVAPAEFGRAGGAVVQVATKSGTNAIHGSAYWFNRSREGAANVFSETQPPELSRNQFGASLGGPIWKNKLFAFLDYQGWRQDIPAGVAQNKVPTALERTGNFTELLSPVGMLATSATSLPDAALPGCSAAMATQPNAFLSTCLLYTSRCV